MPDEPMTEVLSRTASPPKQIAPPTSKRTTPVPATYHHQMDLRACSRSLFPVVRKPSIPVYDTVHFPDFVLLAARIPVSVSTAFGHDVKFQDRAASVPRS